MGPGDRLDSGLFLTCEGLSSLLYLRRHHFGWGGGRNWCICFACGSPIFNTSTDSPLRTTRCNPPH